MRSREEGSGCLLCSWWANDEWGEQRSEGGVEWAIGRRERPKNAWWGELQQIAVVTPKQRSAKCRERKDLQQRPF